MSKKIKIEVLGLGDSQSQSGAYALIIGEVDGLRRLPIIIGSSEAQAIFLELKNYKSSRPLTHDLFYSFAFTFNIKLQEIIINKFSEGIFYSLLVFNLNDTIYEIDSRTSDAIALALKFRCPMYTYEEILREAGIIFEFKTDEQSEQKEQEKKKTKIISDENIEIPKKSLFEKYKTEELDEMLNRAIQNEEYEKAALLRDEIKKRKKQK